MTISIPFPMSFAVTLWACATAMAASKSVGRAAPMTMVCTPGGAVSRQELPRGARGARLGTTVPLLPGGAPALQLF